MQETAQTDWFKISIVVLLVLIVGNLAFLDWKVFSAQRIGNKQSLSPRDSEQGNQVEVEEVREVMIAAGCDDKCQAEIVKEVAKAVGALPTPKPSETTKVVTVKETTKAGTTYIPLNGTFSTVKTSWTDVATSDVYIKAEDYGKSPYISFEASLKSSHAGGVVSVRLFDVTHSIAVDGSELTSSSQNSTQVSSGNLPFWAGNNLYRVQLKSGDGQEVSFSSGRVKIVAQ